jgi:capsular polysaccharide biosynthesis protein
MNNNQAESHNYIEEDEIDLRELWQTILKGKKIIAAITAIVVSLTLIYALKLPNEYKSEALLIPTAEDAGPSLGGLGGLAAMAGVSIGGGGSMTPDIAFNSLLNNYEFMKKFITDNKLVEHYSDKDADANYVFALGFRGIYDLFKSEPDESQMQDYDEQVFDLVKILQKNFSIASDKKTALITVSYSDSDRTYTAKMVNLFLKDASAYLVDNNLRIIDEKLRYFNNEMKLADGFELRQSLSTMISKILQDKVMMQSKVYYQCDVLTAPSEAYIQDKTKPKRGLILVVSFVTSIILGVFLVFFLNFIRDEKSE